MRAIRSGICLIVAFAVLAHGGIDKRPTSILAVSAAALFLWWGMLVTVQPGAALRWNALNWPLLGFISIGAAQLLFRRTVYPFLTELELLNLAACFLIFFLTAQAFHRKRELVFLVWFLLSLAFAVSLFGIAQHFTSNGKIYWTRTVPDGADFFGPFVNRNHFAGFVELIAPLGLALVVFRGVRRDLVPLTGLFLVVPIGALILSGSRAGIISFGFELGLLSFLVWMRHTGKQRLGALAMAALATAALIAWLGAGRTLERFSQTGRGEVSLARRWSMLEGAGRIFLAHPIAGTGLGTLVAVYPKYETMYDGRVVDHAHNDYAEALADTGVLGALCGIVFLWLLFRESLGRFNSEQSHFSRALHAGAIVACGGLLLHSFVDFNLHIPANAILFLIQAQLATSPCLLSEAAPRPQRGRSR